MALKYGLKIPRPETAETILGSYAFPSAHVLRVTVLFGFLAVLVARPLSERWRWLPYSLAGALVGSVAISRLYLGVHWLSDILGSLTLGVAWVALIGIAYHQHTPLREKWRGLAATSLAALIANPPDVRSRVTKKNGIGLELPDNLVCILPVIIRFSINSAFFICPAIITIAAIGAVKPNLEHLPILR